MNTLPAAGRRQPAWLPLRGEAGRRSLTDEVVLPLLFYVRRGFPPHPTSQARPPSPQRGRHAFHLIHRKRSPFPSPLASASSQAPHPSLPQVCESSLAPLLLLSAKDLARLTCSVASALTTARCRCRSFAGLSLREPAAGQRAAPREAPNRDCE